MGNKVLTICGPTAGGKTALALRLAESVPTSIISADSRQVYKGLDVLTGKDIPPGFQKINSKISNIFYTDGQTRLFGFDFFPLLFAVFWAIASSISTAIGVVVAAVSTIISALGAVLSGIFSGQTVAGALI